MKTRQLLCLALMGAVAFLQSCTRSHDDVWEDTKSAGRHVQRGVRTLGGKHCDSRQVRCRSDFECFEEDSCSPEGNAQSYDYQNPGADEFYSPEDFYNQNNYGYQAEEDFVPLQDQANEIAMADPMNRPPRESPGEMGSSLPGIQAFRDPSTIPYMAGVFRPIYFGYNDSLIKGNGNLESLHRIADYMRSHPNVYVFLEGHADERGSQAYNLSLGLHRSNAVRKQLIAEGVDPDHLFTISYGKERPLVLESHEEAWSKNRRVEFKVYER